MLAPVEIDGRRVWLEISVVVDRIVREYQIEDTRVIEIDRVPKLAQVDAVIEERELASMITRDVAWMIKEGLDKKQIVKRIAEIYGMDEHDALEFYHYAEWYLFS